MTSDVSLAKLKELLQEQSEWEELDYKEMFNPSVSGEWVELAKDIGAMQIDGGYLVLGVDGTGTPTGRLSEDQAGKLDEAAVRAKLRKWIPEPFNIRSATHLVDMNVVCLLRIEPHPDGFCIFKADGAYDKRVVFRAGDVFARHGSASERWQQPDIDRIRQHLKKAYDRTEQLQAHEVVLPSCENIAGQATGLLRALSKAALGIDFDTTCATKSDIEEWCKKIAPYADAPLIMGDRWGTWLEYLNHFRQHSAKVYLRVQRFEKFLDARLLSLLAKLEESPYFLVLDSAVRQPRMQNTDISFLANSIWNYASAAQELRQYIVTLKAESSASRGH